MRVHKANEATLVAAAQAGDRQALDDLIGAYLPFVYTIVRRALNGHSDVDDVVQESVLRALREVRGLRTPESFRAWLAAITVRQISTHLRRRHVAAPRSVPLDDLAETPDAHAPFEELTMLQMSLSRQRRQAVRAAVWLRDDERTLLSLWWLEAAGHLTRTELASAVGVSVAHAGVRVQRMRHQLDQCRALVAALDLEPRCAGLGTLAAGWNGTPSPAWRRRISHHIDSCAVCSRTSSQLIAADRLLVGLALLTVPLALAGTLIGKSALIGSTSSAALAAGAKAGMLGHLTQVVATYRIASAVITTALITGTAAVVLNWPASAPPPTFAVTASRSPSFTSTPSPSQPSPTPSARPSSPPTPTPRPLTIGRASLEALDGTGLFAATADSLGVLAPLSPASAISGRQSATFDVVAGLNDTSCFSFRAADGRYLRHKTWRLRLDYNDGTALFRGDSTFCVRAGATPDSLSLEASNYPGWFLRGRSNQLWVDYSDRTAAFHTTSSFHVRPPLTG